MLCRLYYRFLRTTFPWLSLVKASCQIATSRGMEKARAQVRFWRLLYRIDFAKLTAEAIDFVRPEYWT